MSSPRDAAPTWLCWAASPPRAIAIATLSALLLSAVALGLNGFANLGWHAAVRVTAIFAYPFWLLAFTASSLARFFPGPATAALRRRRRAVGLAFAAAQTVHGLTILALARIEPEALTPGLETYFGGLGFVLIWLMAATSNDAMIRRMGGRAWRGLHRYGQIHLAIVYLASYGGRFAADPTYWPPFALLMAAFGLRAASAVQSLRLRSTRLPTE